MIIMENENGYQFQGQGQGQGQEPGSGAGYVFGQQGHAENGAGNVYQRQIHSGKFRFEVDEESPLVSSTQNVKPRTWTDRIKNSPFSFILRAKKYMKTVKVACVFIVLFLAIIAFATSSEPEVNYTFALDSQSPAIVDLSKNAFVEMDLTMSAILESYYLYVNVSLEQLPHDSDEWEGVMYELIEVPPAKAANAKKGYSIRSGGEEGADIGSVVKLTWELPSNVDSVRLNISTNATNPIPLPVVIMIHNAIYRYRVLLAGLVLAGMYVLIVFELVDRVVAAIVGSFFAIATLSLVNARPPLTVIVTWIEYNTLALLFGMMIIVGIFSTTGFFEWIALKAYEFSKGSVWRLVVVLCTFSAVASGFLDNVTSMLLLTPVVLRLCKVVGLSPIPVLLSVVTMSNIGGAATAVGDPPMTIIVNTPEIMAIGVDFAEVFFFCAPGTAVIAVAVMFFLRWYFRDAFGRVTKPAAAKVLQLEKEIDIWKSTEKRLNRNIPEERNVKDMLDKFMFQLTQKLEDERQDPVVGNESMLATGGDNANMELLKKEYQIHDKKLFIYCSIVLGMVVTLFFLEAFISEWVHLPLSWIAVIGAMSLMILADIENIEYLLHKVEWGTLMFFAALFVLLEGLEKLGLVDWVGTHIADYIEQVPKSSRLPTAIVVILWVSAIISAIIDSIPYTTAMIPIIVKLGTNKALDLPMKPLVYALSFGTSLGGNGTLIGSTANLVVIGLAEQYGYPISFVQFAKVGTPIMLISTTIATVYLLLLHIVFGFGMVDK
jgi:Na+/H+ antiporter NhaD/arsenite permease-like protein